MRGVFLFIPLLLVRYGLPLLIDKKTLSKIASFPPMIGKEKLAYVIYQLATLAIFIYSFFTIVKYNTKEFPIASIVFILGLLLLIVATIDFTKKQENELRKKVYMDYQEILCMSPTLYISVVVLC